MPPAPTVPSPAPSLSARRKLREASRDDQARTGGSGAYPSGVRSKLALLRGSPRAPRAGPRPWRFAARQIRNLRPCSRSLRFRKPKPRTRGWRDPRPKPRFRLWQSMDRDPGSCRFAAPEPKPGPARRSGQASPPVAARRLSSRFRRTDRDLRPHLPAGFPDRGPKDRLGAFRSLPLSHPLKGKPAASAWRRLRQPPRLRFPTIVW